MNDMEMTYLTVYGLVIFLLVLGTGLALLQIPSLWREVRYLIRFKIQAWKNK